MEHLEHHQHAFLDENNIVINVVVFEESAHDSSLLNDIQSVLGAVKIICCCTVGQIAGIGFTYDATRDAFIAPQPYNSWTLDEATCSWQPPTSYPTNGKIYYWSEDDLSWRENQ